MVLTEVVRQFWMDICNQRWSALSTYFHADAVIRWHNTNEQFTVNEFIRINEAYPGDWLTDIVRVESTGNSVITAVRVYQENAPLSFHAVSFFEFRGSRIAALDEYWGADEKAPQWRLDQRIGSAIPE